VASTYFKNTKSLYGTRGAEINKRELAIGKTKVTLYQRKDNGSPSWYFKMRIKGERQYYKRSLKTSSFPEAKELAEEAVIGLLGAIKAGDKIVSPSIQEISRQYRKHLEDSVRRGQRRPSTIRNMFSRLATGERFLKANLSAGMNTKVGTLDGTLFEGYLVWREAEVRGKTKNQAALSMIRDELLVIRAAFKWANSQKLAPSKSIPVWTSFKSPEVRRRRFTRADYNRVTSILTAWAKKKTTDEKQRYYTEMVRHGFLIIANSGLRSGELFGLRNSDLVVNTESKEVTIRVRAETTKVKQERRVVLRAVEAEEKDDRTESVNYLIRWLKFHQKHKEQKDYVFSAFEGGLINSRERFYDIYKKHFRPRLKKHGLEKFDLYHCRHMFITFRLEADQNIYKIAKATGTSLTQIEKTYSHLLAEQASREIQQVRNRETPASDEAIKKKKSKKRAS
jgi:integrase